MSYNLSVKYLKFVVVLTLVEIKSFELLINIQALFVLPNTGVHCPLNYQIIFKRMSKSFSHPRSDSSSEVYNIVKSIIKRSNNNIGWKSILGHLLFCERRQGSSDMFQFCSRMIAYENEHDDMLSTLDDIYLETFSISDKHIRNAYEMLTI